MASEDIELRLTDFSNLEELMAAQRKEKKDLIAKTQKMKHSVPKGDKKKKKEITAEIAQLLADLDLKHEAQLKLIAASNTEQSNGPSEQSNEPTEPSNGSSEPSENLQDKSDNLSEGDTNLPNGSPVENDHIDVKSTQRVTKAQKRRNKKAALVKERNKAIAEQELENLSGLRHVESEEIKKKLSERNLAIFEIPSDGNCLYKAIEHQLSVLKLPAFTVQLLREATSKYMLSHTEDYMPFLTSSETGDGFNEEMYIKYCEDIIKTPAWGGHIEIQVLSHILDLPIEIIQAEGPNIIIGDDNVKSKPKLTLSYHRHVFGLGEHYNSVIPVAE